MRSPPPNQGSTIDGRPREVMTAAVETYIASGEPVASGALARPLRLSSALVRNIMAGLEQQGLLQQPHTSSGRVPTDAGYRVYVDQLLSFGEPVGDVGAIEWTTSDREDARALMRASLLPLTHSTGLLGFAVSTLRDEELHHHVELVRTGPSSIMAIFIGSQGTVRRRAASVPSETSASDLERFRNVLNERFRGLTLGRIRQTLDELVAGARQECAALEAEALELSRALLPEDTVQDLDVAVMGHHRLLTSPEFQVGALAARVLEELERRETWLGLLEAVSHGSELGPEPQVRVFIGHENPTDALSGCTVVLTSLPWSAQRSGTIGVIGPTRLAYRTTIGAVSSVRAGVVALTAP